MADSPQPETTSTRLSRSPSPQFASIELTPRSKVKQMLAAIDDSDADDTDPTPQSEPVVSHQSARSSPPPTTHQDSIGSGSESDVPQPRHGTLAARMQAQSGMGESASEGASDGDAYRRVRRKLLSKSEKKIVAEEQQPTQPRSLKHTTDASPQSAPVSRSPSPGLFVSPEKAARGSQHSSAEIRDEHAPSQPATVTEKLKALAERRRREARETGKDMSSGEDSEPQPASSSAAKSRKQPVLEMESETDDGETGKKLTQHSRPNRKASKKAIEEMHRETQRMSRNMQLTHEARTKMKFSTTDLFAKFNFRQQGQPTKDPQAHVQPMSSSTAPSSDSERIGGHETPPSSPPSTGGKAPSRLTELQKFESLPTPDLEDGINPLDDLDELPDLKDLLSRKTQIDKQLNHPKDQTTTDPQEQIVEAEPKRVSVRRFAKSSVKPRRLPIADDDDDDLEIVKPRKPSRLKVFDQLPASKARESHSLHTLRALAYLNESDRPRKKKGRISMATSELQVLLHQRARQQALQERDEKIQRLRDKGVIVQTAEEKEKEQLQLESMLERARKEADELAKREKEAAKREGKEDGDVLDDDDDEDYQASDEGEVNPLSGSEDEGEEGDDQGEASNEEEEGDEEDADGSNYGKSDEEAENTTNDMIQHEASDDGEEVASEDDPEVDSSDDSEMEVDAMQPSRSRNARRRVVDSDDEEAEQDSKQMQQTPAAPQLPTTPAAVRVPITPKTTTKDAFGFSNQKPAAGLGLSQVFAGTMAEDDTQADTQSEADQDSMAFLRSLPAPELPNYDDSHVMDSPRTVVEDSQVRETPSRSASTQMTGLVSFDTQTQLPEPTQDDGFQIRDSQPPLADASYATVDTIPIQRSPSPQPEVKQTRRRRLKRSVQPIVVASDEEDVGPDREEANDQVLSSDPLDAFAQMRQKRAEAAEAAKLVFDKDRSKAKEMFEEQAEESEDEYAGLGGASDDEDHGEADEETRKMIDDDGKELTDERDIAAYYADKERREDEKGIEKLYKDVINGGLRRKRGADHGLWDSDDEDEAASRRRAAKQRDFAKMRKALMADEKIGKIAGNPKQAAFLQALEDRDEMDELDFFDRPDESQSGNASQQDSNPAQPLSSISGNVAGTKRTLAEYAGLDQASQDAENMPPPANPRRAKAAKITRPTSLADIRNTLSEIIGEPESVLESQRLGSESPNRSDDENAHDQEAEDEEALYRHPSLPSPPREKNPRRTNAEPNRAGVINRIALKKQNSSLGRSIDANQSRLAFQPTNATAFSTKVPSLLRRATSNSSISSLDTGAGPSIAAGGLGGKDVVKRGGSAKSSVNYYVRELEKKGKLEKIEKERMEGRARVGKMRRQVLAGTAGGKAVGMSGLVGGNFD